jgi:hypothetical protein
MTARRASRHACAKGEVSLSGANVTPLFGAEAHCLGPTS